MTEYIFSSKLVKLAALIGTLKQTEKCIHGLIVCSSNKQQQQQQHVVQNT